MTNYKQMQYPEMLQAFREQNKKNNDFYTSFEKDRQLMQRASLKLTGKTAAESC